MCGQSFASLWSLAMALALHWLSACTASLHVAPYRGFTTMLNPMQILTFAPWQDVRFGSKADICAVRNTPESGHMRCNQGCPLWARSGPAVICKCPLSHDFHSTTSVAAPSKVLGNVSPRRLKTYDWTNQVLSPPYQLHPCTSARLPYLD